MIKHFISFLILSGWIGFINAQTENDSLKHLETAYQTWLEETGISQILKVHTIRQTNSQTTLYLAFHTEDPAACFAKWQLLDQGFKQVEGRQVEEVLYYQLSFLLPINGPKPVIQIYDTYNLDIRPCFFLNIELENQIPVSNLTRCKIKPAGLTKDTLNLNLPEPAQHDFYYNLGENHRYSDILLSFLKNKFFNHYCCNDTMKAPFVVLEHSDSDLKLRFDDIAPEKLDLPCHKRNCDDWVKEKLYFNASFSDEPGKTVVKLEITSAYSGANNSGAYERRPMDFDHQMKTFAQQLLNDMEAMVVKLNLPRKPGP